VPHVRDTDAWDPERYDRQAVRARLGVGDDPVVMFLGTPRGYKGIDDLVEAVRLLGDRVVLALVGIDGASGWATRWNHSTRVKVIGEIPFDEVPSVLVGADIVAIPQRATTDTVGQVPAKLIDAMAMARPIVATGVSMIPEILEGCGIVVPPSDPPALAKAIDRLLMDRAAAEAMGRRARERCIAHYSFAAARATLFPLIDQVSATHPGAAAPYSPKNHRP
jgi:glycosyltransferase involved in cell wall biosynthesis